MQKTRFYGSKWSDKNKNLYYCHGFSRNDSDMRNGFIKHQHCMANCSVDWYVFLPSILYIIYWNIFNAFVVVVWSAWNFDLLLFLLNFWIHVMTVLSESSYLLTTFRPIKGFEIWAWCEKKLPPLFWLKIITS